MSIPRTDYMQRIAKYCAEAEKCSYDVIAKLISWGIPKDEAEIILLNLRQNNLVNDQRYIVAYVNEHFRSKWGKTKMLYALRQKQMPDDLIESTLDGISEEDYKEMIYTELADKLREIKSDTPVSDAKRIMFFAQSRGYEEEFVMPWLQDNVL